MQETFSKFSGLWVEARDYVKYFTAATKNYSAQNVKSAKVEKL